MKLSQWKSLSVLATLVAMFVGGGSLAIAAHHEAPNSGFLDADVAAKLKKTRLPDKREVMRWMSPQMNKKNW